MLNVVVLFINCKLKFNGMILPAKIMSKICRKVGNGKTLTKSMRKKSARAKLRTEKRKIKNKILKNPMNKLNNNNELFVTFFLYLISPATSFQSPMV